MDGVSKGFVEQRHALAEKFRATEGGETAFASPVEWQGIKQHIKALLVEPG